jgi:hypothetical protein
MTDDELSGILEESRQWNLDHGITGMLLYVEGIFVGSGTRNITSAHAGRFMQILEGTEEEVEKIFDKIRQDKRHFNVNPLKNSYAADRCFESWQMGFKALSTSDLKDNSAFFFSRDFICRGS